MPADDHSASPAASDIPGAARTDSSQLLKIALWSIGGVVAWLLLLNLTVAPLEPQLEPSWMAVITYGAANDLQFGREIIYTYGPLGYLAFSTFSDELFGSLILGRCFVTAFYVFSVCWLSRRFSFTRSAYLLGAGLVIPIFSYQAMYLFALVSAGWLIFGRQRTNILLACAGLLFLAIAALVKFTFLWFAVLVVLTGAITAAYQQRMARALIPPFAFVVLVSGLWLLAGQDLSSFDDFVWAGLQVTTGYAATMTLPAPTGVLVAGIATGVLAASQLILLVWRNRAVVNAVTVGVLLAAALFLAWKLGFSRADAHTTEFFYFAILLTAATPLYFIRSPRGYGKVWRGAIFAMVTAIGIWVVSNYVPGFASDFLTTVKHRWRHNTSVLLHPTRARGSMETSQANQAQANTLRRIKERVGQAPVTVFGHDQAIALANRLQFITIPTVQTYCEYTPALAELNAEFFRTDRAPQFVIFKLQPIDNRIPTIEGAKLILKLAHDYEPVLAERGYLLLERKATPSNFALADLPISAAGEIAVGQPIAVPSGIVWCELDIRATLLGKLLAFLYQPPAVELEIVTTAGKKLRRRILPTLSGRGFLINPLVRSEEDFVRFASGDSEAATTVKTIRVVKQKRFRQLMHRQISYRFRAVPAPSGSAVAEGVLRELTGYADIFSRPASSIQSPLPVDRFALHGKEFLLVHPPGEVRIDIPRGAKSVSGSYAIRPDAYAGSEGVLFQVDYLPGGGTAVQLHQRMLAPQTAPADHGLQHFRCDLPPDATGQISLRTQPGPTGKIEWGWAGWADIRFE